MFLRRLKAAVPAAACLLMLVSAVQAGPAAGGISVSPVRVDLGAAQRSAALTIINGDVERFVQVEALRWRRSENEDHYTPADELIVNPPLFKLAPGAKQVVRLGLTEPAGARADERAYRVYFQDVPQETAAAGSGTHLQMVLRLGVPVFVAPDVVRPQLHWSAGRTVDGFRLVLQNRGNVHARLTDLAVRVPAESAPIASAPALRYIFPGESSAWTFQLNGPLAAQVLEASVQGEGGVIHAEVPLAAP